MPRPTLYATAAPAHTGRLYYATRPLPGREIGNAGGFVYDVQPEFEDLARRDDGQPITLITPARVEQLAEQLVTADGYSRARYEDLGAWNPDQILRDHNHAVIGITPTADAGPLITLLDRLRQAGRDAWAAGEVRAPALSTIVHEAIKDLRVGEGAAELMTAYQNGWEEAADEAPPEFTGDYTGVAADEFHLGSMQLVAPGAYIGEDPEPSTTHSLLFGDSGDMAVCLHGTPEQLRAFAARVAELVATL